MEDSASLSQQLEQMSIIGRCEYEQTCRQLLQFFEAAASAYQTLLAQSRTPDPGSNQLDTKLQEGTDAAHSTQLPCHLSHSTSVFLKPYRRVLYVVP